jgi:dTDP-glucose pyrophosphorylase
MLNIVIPMAGRGSRFANAGYKDPKPLIPVGGKPMIQWIIENICPSRPHRFIFICLEEHLDRYPEVTLTLRKLAPRCEIITVNQVTEGAACTVLLAEQLIDNDDPLMIANADQFVAINVEQYLMEIDQQKADGLIMTFWSDHPKWSYCRLKSDGSVAEVVEKKVVSNEATVGIYNFRKGSQYIKAARAMIANNLRVNNEFYVAPTYNSLINSGAKVVVKKTGYEYSGMFGLGTPEDLEFFKTTQQFQSGKIGKKEPDWQIIAQKTSFLVRFFNDRNLAGLAALLADTLELSGPSWGQVGPKEVALAEVGKVFKCNPEVMIKSDIITASIDKSYIKCSLTTNKHKMTGVIYAEWSNQKIVKLQSHLKE